MDSIKYVGDRRTYLSEGVAPLHMIDNIFRVILPHYGFAVREEQIELAKTMFKGFVGKAVSVCEADAAPPALKRPKPPVPASHRL